MDDSVAAARRRGVHFAALVPNLKGFETLRAANERAKAVSGLAPLDTVVVLVSCTDSHSKANVNRTMAQATEATLDIITSAKQSGLRVRAYASLAFGCPFEGNVSEDVVVRIAKAYAEAGADVVCLADTLGVGVPDQVTSLVGKLLANDVVPAHRLALHLHDSHRRAHENVSRALEMGVRDFDAAVGGCGGCNFAPGSAGNISVEKLLAVCKRAGVPFDVDEAVVRANNAKLSALVGRSLETLESLPRPERAAIGL